MFTLYALNSIISGFQFAAVRLEDFGGVNKRFEDVPSHGKREGHEFLLFKDDQPYQIWVIWWKNLIMGTQDIQAWNEASDRVRGLFAAIGGDLADKRYANNVAGYIGNRLLSVKGSATCDCCGQRRYWPPITAHDSLAVALFRPDEYLEAVHPGWQKPNHKEMKVDGQRYFVQFVRDRYHVFTSRWKYLGDFWLVQGGVHRDREPLHINVKQSRLTADGREIYQTLLRLAKKAILQSGIQSEEDGIQRMAVLHGLLESAFEQSEVRVRHTIQFRS